MTAKPWTMSEFREAGLGVLEVRNVDRFRATVEALAAKEAEVERLKEEHLADLKDARAQSDNMKTWVAALFAHVCRLTGANGANAPTEIRALADSYVRERDAKAQEEQREAGFRNLEEHARSVVGEDHQLRTAVFNSFMAAAARIRSVPLDSTPLADRIRELEADLKLCDEKYITAADTIGKCCEENKTRAEAAEARVKELGAAIVARAERIRELESQLAMAELNDERRDLTAMVKTLTEERDAARAEFEDAKKEWHHLNGLFEAEKTAHLATRREADRLRERAVECFLGAAELLQASHGFVVADSMRVSGLEHFKRLLSYGHNEAPRCRECAGYGIGHSATCEKSALASTSEPAPCASCVRLREALSLIAAIRLGGAQGLALEAVLIAERALAAASEEPR